MADVIVENTTARLLVIPPAGALDGAAQRGRTALKPGFSSVDEGILDAVMDANACVGMWFECGMLRLAEGRRELPMPETLEAITAKEAAHFIERSDDAEQLRDWLEGEERLGVSKMLHARLAELGETE